MIQEALRKVTDGEDLTRAEAAAVATEIMDGAATHIQTAALLAALRTKRESVEEITGFAAVMRGRCVRVTPRKRPLLDTCGTGGDTCKTFNISTAAAFVIAAAGIAVAKHGNRGVTSPCGSADVLAALGVEVALPPEHIATCIDTVGLGFMYAPHHHPATKHAAPARREMGIRTLFNLLGPLTNPAGASHQLIGVFDPDLCPKMAEALGNLGSERALVVHGMAGIDEISTVSPTRISELQHGRVRTDVRIPAEFFVVPAQENEIAAGASVEENAEILLSVLKGESGPRRDVVCVNACAGLMLGGMAEGWRDGLSLAHRMIDSGKAVTVLNRLVQVSQHLAEQARAEGAVVAQESQPERPARPPAAV